MAIDITQLPGMGGQTGSIVGNAVQAIENAVLCVGTGSLFDCFSAIINFALSIFDIFISIFSSRPKVGIDSASDDTALFFIPSSNPIITLWGVGIRDLESQGIPTSASGGAGAAAQTALAQAVYADLQQQFDGPNAGKVTLNGATVTAQQIFDLYHYLGFQTNHPDSNTTSINARAQLDQLYTDLVNLRLIDPHTGFPFPPGSTPPPPPPPPIIPPPLWPPPPGTFDTPDGDEFTDCCDETQAAFNQVLQALKGFTPGTTSTDPTCCTNIVNAISAVVQQLARLGLVLQSHAGTTIDFSPVVSAIDSITAALGALPGPTGNPVHVNVDNWPPPSAGGPAPTDVTPIVDQLKLLVREGDVKQGILDYLSTQGFMSSSLAQVLHGADWSDAIVSIFRTFGWDVAVWALSLVGVTWTGAKWTFSIASLRGAIAGDVESAIVDSLTVGAWPLEPVVKGMIDGIVQILNPVTAVGPGNSGVDTAALVSKTIAPSFLVSVISFALGYLGWNTSHQLNHWAEAIAVLTGFEEIKEVEIGQRMQAGPIAAARLQAQKTYRQSIPGAGAASNWLARHLIDVPTARNYMALAGYGDRVQDSFMLAAQTGIAPRQLLRLIPSGLLSDVELKDEMKFAGMRAVSAARLLAVAPYIATESWRAQLRSALEAEYSAGLLSDAQLVNALDNAEHNTSRTFLILDRVHSQEAVAIAKALESEYSTMYRAGLIDHATYVANLSGMGLQQWKVDALAGIEDAKAMATLQRQMLAQQRALARATAAEERKAAMAAFRTGTIDAVALAAALVATGLTAVQAAAWVSLAQLQSTGNLRWIYGVQKNPADAQVLQQRVTALTDQAKKEHITMQAFTDALKALGLPAHIINALSAKVAATITPKADEFVVTVQTN